MPTQITLGVPENRRDESTGEILGQRYFVTGTGVGTKVIYARPNGSDVSPSEGDGSAGKPYRTFLRALQDAPLICPDEESYLIDITGLGVEALPDDFVMPNYISAQPTAVDPAPTDPLLTTREVVTIYAKPDLLETLAPGDVTLQTVDTKTLLVTVTTTKNYLLNQWADRLILGSGPGEVARIVGNTAGPNSVLDVVVVGDLFGPAALTPPLTIVQESATLTNSGSTAEATLTLRGVTAGVAFAGIKFDRTGGPVAVQARGCRRLVFAGCEFSGKGAIFSSVQDLLGIGLYNGFAGAGYTIEDTGFMFQNSLYDADIFFLNGSSRAIGFHFKGAVFVSPTDPLGITDVPLPFGDQQPTEGVLILDSARFDAPADEGVKMRRGTLRNVQINNFANGSSGANGLHVLQNGSVLIEGLYGVGAAGSGVGIQADDGSDVFVNDRDSDIAGDAGGIRCNTKSARSWIDFRTNAPLQNETDYVGDTAGGARIHTIPPLCFLVGTPVWTVLGQRPIETLRVGDTVPALEPDTERRGDCWVEEVCRSISEHLRVLRLNDGSIINTTDHHPFWVADRKRWVDAADLIVGDILFSRDGNLFVVSDSDRRVGKFDVVNLRVRDLHTFFVGDAGILVHNK